MGMALELRRVTAKDAQTLVQNPGEVLWFLTGLDAPQPGFLARLFGAKPPPEREWKAPPEEMVTDVDKAWHCIHYLLAGDAEGGPLPAGFLVHGGEQLGDADIGYGPARLLRPEEVRSFSELIAPISELDLRQRFDPAALMKADIYPGIWDRDEEEFEYVWTHFSQLQRFVGAAARAGDGIIVYLA